MYPSTKYEGSSFLVSFYGIQVKYLPMLVHVIICSGGLNQGWARGHWGLWHESSAHEDWWKPTEGNSLGEILTSDWHKYMEKEAELERGWWSTRVELRELLHIRNPERAWSALDLNGSLLWPSLPSPPSEILPLCPLKSPLRIKKFSHFSVSLTFFCLL